MLLIIVFGGCRPPTAPPDSSAELFAAIDAEAAATGEPAENWTKATAPREFDFPADHGSHEDFRIEWWYYTGNLTSDNGREFGYQLTFFRTGLHQAPANPSRWAVRNLYTAHFAISDVKNRQHVQAQRNNRGAIGQAGAETGGLHVWNGNWSVTADGDTHTLIAEHQGNKIELKLTPTKLPVTHGKHALSQKGAAEGNASYYYSFTNMATEGTITIDGKPLAVTGKSWMDHEFSTSFLEPGQLGWDWFAIQFDNNTELMLYRMRRDDGTSDPYSSGSFVDSDGKLTHLNSTDFELTPTRSWKSPQSAAAYPLAWQMKIPRLSCQLELQSKFDNQEMLTGDTTGITYWEGAIRGQGTLNGSHVRGIGYLELTGYVGRGLGSLLQ